MARTPKPWYRANKRGWFATMAGRQVSLGVTDPNDEAGAWDALRKLVHGAVKEAISPAAGVKPGTVKQLVSEFLESKKPHVKPRTLRGYGQYLGWLSKHWGYLELSELSVEAIRNCSDGEVWSDTHRANTLWCVNVFLRWCGRAEQLPLPPKESRGAEAVIPDAIHRRVLAETKGDFRALVQLLWLSGCRPGEATGLAAESVNWSAGAAIVKQHKTRHKGKTRRIPLCTEAQSNCSATRRRSTGRRDYSSGGLKGKLFSLQAMVMRFERISVKVGHKVTSYMYRHTFATRALAAGESDTVVAGILGHANRP